jgi:hypothetical protein
MLNQPHRQGRFACTACYHIAHDNHRHWQALWGVSTKPSHQALQLENRAMEQQTCDQTARKPNPGESLV